MRRLRITVVVAAFACVVGALASPALANKTKPKAFFGEFTASTPTGGPISDATPAIAKTKHGTLDAFSIGHEETGPFAFSCKEGEEGGLTSEAKVTSERSTSFKTEVKFHKCTATRRLKGGLEEHNLKTKFEKGFEIEFFANGAFKLGKEEPGEFKITKGTKIEINIHGAMCKLVIPEQTVPDAAENKEGEIKEKEFEGGEYSGERESTEKLKLYPDGFIEKLEVDWTLSKFIVEIPVEQNSGCSSTKESGSKYNAATKSVEFPSTFEGELEEIGIKRGEIFFETATEHKEKEV